MKKIFLSLLILTAGMSAFNQNNFLPGSITKKSGELIIGYIDYREWTINPSKIRFKTDLQRIDSFFTAFDLSVSSRLLGSFSNTNGVNVKPTLIAMRVSYKF